MFLCDYCVIKLRNYRTQNLEFGLYFVEVKTSENINIVYSSKQKFLLYHKSNKLSS